MLLRLNCLFLLSVAEVSTKISYHFGENLIARLNILGMIFDMLASLLQLLVFYV
jgi:hypothetical protein